VNKFKVGDRVRTTTDNNDLTNLCGRPKGYEFTINQVFEGKWYRERKGMLNGVQASDLELVEETNPTPKFKVGDKVRVRLDNLVSSNGRFYFQEAPEKYTNYRGILTIKEIIDDSRWQNRCVVGEILEGKYQSNVCLNNDELELVKEDCNGCDIKINEPTNSSINKVGEIMSNLTRFVKNSLLSADEKLLRKMGLKDDCGEYTDEAEVLITLKLIKDNESYLIEVAKGLEAEEKANK
jgi:hypothetical protein